TAPPTGDVTIPVTSLDLTEGTVSPGSLTFTAADWNVPQTVTVTGQPDGVLDGNVAYTVPAGASTSAVPNYNGLPAQSVALTDNVRLLMYSDGVSNDSDARVGGRLVGQAGGVPLVGNWNGTVGDEVGLYRPETGVFTLDTDGDLVSQDADDSVITRLAGKVGGRPLVGDWNGDGTDNVGLFIGVTGRWFLDTNSDAAAEKVFTAVDGKAGGAPVVGDFNGDGVTDCGIFRPLLGRWIIDLNGNGVYDAGGDLIYK